MYKRKTIDRWDIETNYGYGWDIECSEYTLRDARQTYKEYIDNLSDRCLVRLTKRRERIEK